MLFSYIQISHPLERLHTWLEHLVKEVWCKPRPHFYVRLLHPEFQEVVRETLKQAKKHDYLWGPIRKIHNICRDELNAAQRTTLAKWFDDNNNIEALCDKMTGVNPVSYAQVATLHKQLANELKSFCTNLWGEVRKLKPVTDRIGTLNAHFKEFRKVNKTGTCPYCGINRIEGVFTSIQEDYDHYLPKGTYPFNSTSLKNLAPICDKCNKKYKLQSDPIHKEDGTRRSAFYGYATASNVFNFTITLVPSSGNPIDIQNLQPDNIKLDIKTFGSTEEVEGWKEVFKIEERYKDLCCEGVTGGNYWLEQVLGEMKLVGKGPLDALATIKRAASVSKWADANFLKVPFLEGCLGAGLIR